jgi:aminomethyltransferase
VDWQEAVAVGDALTDVGRSYGLAPAGIWALDIARIEAGLIMLDVDYFSSHRALIEDQKSSPYEINLGWTVSETKGPFNGQRALRAEKTRGPAWRFVGLEVDWHSFEALHSARGLAPHVPSIAWRTSHPLYAGGKQVGYATSGTWSPLLKRYLALGHVSAAHGKPGTELDIEITVEHRRNRARATVRKLPFFDPPRKRE